MLYFVSDIHGEYEMLLRLFEKINFSPDDEMIVLGDMIDKGKSSVRVISHLMKMNNVRCILGNHEHIFLKEYYFLMEDSPKDFSDVLKTLQAHFPEDGELLTFEMVDWLESLPYFVEGEDFIAVHGGLPIDEKGYLVKPRDAFPEQMIYDREFMQPRVMHRSPKCVIFGHTPTSYLGANGKILAHKRKGRDGKTLSDFYKIHIDTGAWSNGVLGCFCKEKLTATYIKR